MHDKQVMTSSGWQSLTARYKIFVLSTVCAQSWNRSLLYDEVSSSCQTIGKHSPLSQRARDLQGPWKQFAHYLPVLEILKPEFPFELTLCSTGDIFFFDSTVLKGLLILAPKNQRAKRVYYKWAKLSGGYTDKQTITPNSKLSIHRNMAQKNF